MYGIDWSGPISEDLGEGVPVEDLPPVLPEADFESLRREFDPLEDDGNYGITMYGRVSNFVATHMF